MGPRFPKNRKQTRKNKKKQTNQRRNENPKPQSMGSFKISFLSTVYLRCWLRTYWTDTLPGQEVVEQDEALLHTHQHDLLHGDGWQGQGLSTKKQKQTTKYLFPRPQVSIANATAASGLDFHFKRHLLFFTDTDKRKVTWPLVV